MYGFFAIVKENGLLGNVLGRLETEKMGFDKVIFIRKEEDIYSFVHYYKPYLLVLDNACVTLETKDYISRHFQDKFRNKIIVCGSQEIREMREAFLNGASDYLSNDVEIQGILESIHSIKKQLDRETILQARLRSPCVIQFFRSIAPVLTKDLVLNFLKLKGEYLHYRCIMNSLKIDDEIFDQSLFRSFKVSKINIGEEHPTYVINYTANKESALQEIISKSSIKLHLGVSDRFQNLEEILFYLQQAKKRSYRSFFGEDTGELFFSSDSQIVGNFIDSFDIALQRRDLDKVLNVINGLPDYFRQNKLTIDTLEIVYNHFVDMLVRIALAHEAKIGDIKRFSNCGQMVDCFGNIHVLLDYLTRKITDIFSVVGEEGFQIVAQKTSSKIYEIKAYVDEHFREEVTLSSLANQYYISSNYLSNQFKLITQKTFSSYLLDKRLEYAAFLLKNTNLKVGDISTFSGFNEYSYFKRVFKRRYQYTPTEYRNIILLGKE